MTQFIKMVSLAELYLQVDELPHAIGALKRAQRLLDDPTV